MYNLMTQNNKLLRIEELVLYFNSLQGPVQAVDGVNFSLDYNRAVVILGESGCGKSSLAKGILAVFILMGRISCSSMKKNFA
jgi:peptide/nickel transport system ATP-binding protein